MGFSIDSFKSNGLPLGGARPSLFEVQCQFPQSTGSGLSVFGEQGGRFICNATQLPGWIVEPVRVPYFGRVVKFKGDRQFQDWNVTVLNDEDFGLRDAFESWSNHMNYMESNIMDTAFAGQGTVPGAPYKQDLTVTQFAKDGPPGDNAESGRPIRAYQIVGAWPSQISPIQLSWGSQNEIETFDVTFAYDYFTVFGATTTPGTQAF